MPKKKKESKHSLALPNTKPRVWNVVDGARIAQVSQAMPHIRRKEPSASQLFDAPLHWRLPSTVIVSPTRDLFLSGLTPEWISAIFGVMALCPQHTFIVSTAGVEGLRKWMFEDCNDYLPASNRECLSALVSMPAYAKYQDKDTFSAYDDKSVWPLPNVWLGCCLNGRSTVANNDRIRALREIPAKVRFAHVDLSDSACISVAPHLWPTHPNWPSKYASPEAALADGATVRYERQALVMSDANYLNWVLVYGHLAVNLERLRSIIKECERSQTSCYVHKLGVRPFYQGFSSRPSWYAPSNRKPLSGERLKHWRFDYPSPESGVPITYDIWDPKGEDWLEWPEELRVRKWPI